MPELASVVFEPREDGFIASAPLSHLGRMGARPDASLQEACRAYNRTLIVMQAVLDDIDQLKGQRIPIPARKMWELGDAVVNLGADLERDGLELDNLSEHLVRDLGINGKRMGTIITFRRHLPDQELIPESLGWSQCEKQARKVAEELKSGQPVAG